MTDLAESELSRGESAFQESELSRSGHQKLSFESHLEFAQYEHHSLQQQHNTTRATPAPYQQQLALLLLGSGVRSKLGRTPVVVPLALMARASVRKASSTLVELSAENVVKHRSTKQQHRTMSTRRNYKETEMELLTRSFNELDADRVRKLFTLIIRDHTTAPHKNIHRRT